MTMVSHTSGSRTQIAAEAELDGIYVIRTSVRAGSLDIGKHSEGI